MSSYTEGQIHQLSNALEAAKFSPEDITKLGQFENLSGVRGLFRGTHELKQVKHVIDCDADPFCPDGWEVEEHHKGGQLEWGAEIQFFLSEGQKDGNWIEGNKLRKELKGKPVFNANVLDYLLKNLHLIPGEWKSKKAVFFWGTVYRYSDGNLVVRYLHWDGGEWDWNYDWLDNDFDDCDPTVLIAS